MNATFEDKGNAGEVDRVAMMDAIDGKPCLFQLLYQAGMNQEMTIRDMQKALACEDYETARKLADRLTAQYDDTTSL